MPPYELLPLHDPAPIRAFLRRDPPLSAYALGDLDPALWPESAFWGALQGGELVTVTLLYRGLTPPVLTAFGAAEGFRATLEALALPAEVYALLLPEYEADFRAFYRLHHPHYEWRMLLEPQAFAPPPLDGVQRLGPQHVEALAALFRQAADPGEEIVAFTPSQIARGAFFGVWRGEELLAVAGTHVWARGEGVAAIGNVFTRPDARGRGYATRCTAAVVRQALREGMRWVVLNVRRENAPALRVYEKLGFRRYGAFVEGPALRLR